MEKHTQEDTFCQQVDGGEYEAGYDADQGVGKEILSRMQTFWNDKIGQMPEYPD